MYKKLSCILMVILILAQATVFAQTDSEALSVGEFEIVKTVPQDGAGMSVTASAEVRNRNSDTSIFLTMYVVSYSGPTVSAVKKQEFEVLSGERKVISASLMVKPNALCKAFIWQSGSMTPVTKVVSTSVADTFTVKSEQVYDAERDYMVASKDVFNLTGERKIFSYWNDRATDSRISVASVSEDAKIIWNNAAPYYLKDTAMQKEDVVPARGSVTVSDTDLDGQYDLFEVKAYDVATVASVDAAANRIDFKPEKTIDSPYVVLSTDEYPNLKSCRFTLDGAGIGLEDLQEYDVLNIYTDNWSNPTYFDIIVTRNYVQGMVTELNVIDECFVVDGEMLQLTEGLSGAALPELEEEGRFYRDMDGYVAFIDSYNYSIDNCAYLYRTGVGTFLDEFYVRLFTNAGADVAYQVANKVTINGVMQELNQYYTKSQLHSMFDSNIFEISPELALASEVFEGASNVNLTPRILLEYLTEYPLRRELSPTGDSEADRLIGFTVQYDRITRITLAGTNPEKRTLQFNGIAQGAAWDAKNNRFNTGSDIGTMLEEANIFFLSPDRDIADYHVSGIESLEDGKIYIAYLYGDAGKGAKIALILDADIWLGQNESLCVLEEWTSSLINSKPCYLIKYWENGSLAEDLLTAAGELRDLIQGMEKGDVFLYSTDQSGMVQDIDVIFSPGINAIPYYTSFRNMVDLKGAENYKYIGEEGNQENEVYFGYVGKTVDTFKGLRMTLVDETGKFSENSSKTFVVPYTANVIYYNPAMASHKQIQSASAYDICTSGYEEDSEGNMDFENTSLHRMNYAFIKTNKDVVTDVIYIRYAR